MQTTWMMKGSGVAPKSFAIKIDAGAKRLDSFAAEAANSVAAHIASRGYANAPILSGKLRSSIVHTPAEKEGTTFTSIVKLTDEDNALFYAPLMYTFLQPYAVFPLFNLGPISRQQPMQPEGGVGGQWFVRVANYHNAQYLKKITDAVAKLFTTGRLERLTFTP